MLAAGSNLTTLARQQQVASWLHALPRRRFLLNLRRECLRTEPFDLMLQRGDGRSLGLAKFVNFRPLSRPHRPLTRMDAGFRLEVAL